MNIMPQSHRQQSQTQPNDDELGDILAGVSSDPNEPARSSATPMPDIAGLQFEDPSTSVQAVPVKRTAQAVSEAMPSATPTETQIPPAVANSAPATPTSSTTRNADPALESIKKSALEELRPLVSKLNLPPEEKFDTLLLIIRSTDDQTLLADAHEAAQSITDDTKRAAALLDVIKEIDYFSNPQQ